MNGATTEPCDATITTANATNIIANGTSQYFFLAAAYLIISLRIENDFIKIGL